MSTTFSSESSCLHGSISCAFPVSFTNDANALVPYETLEPSNVSSVRKSRGLPVPAVNAIQQWHIFCQSTVMANSIVTFSFNFADDPSFSRS